MPRTRMDELYTLAEEHVGLFTSKEARDRGIQDSVLVRLAQRGRLERMSRGVYRIAHFRLTGLPNTGKLSYGRRQIIMARSASLYPTRPQCWSTASRI